jgi:hypothetical protein
MSSLALLAPRMGRNQIPGTVDQLWGIKGTLDVALSTILLLNHESYISRCLHLESPYVELGYKQSMIRPAMVLTQES